MELRPQAYPDGRPHPQELFLSSDADIAIYGGAAGGGKTWSLLFEPLYYAYVQRVPNFYALFLRRTYPQIFNPGGLYDEAGRLYSQLKPQPKLNKSKEKLQWAFPWGAYIRLGNLQYDDSVYKYQGAQIPLICFDELTHFSKKQFFYMLSRNRSTSGIPGYVRGSCNPDAGSWVKDLLAPWVDHKYPNPAVSGELRYFIVRDDVITWVDKNYLGPPIPGQGPESGERPKSITYVAASIFDNFIQLAKDPGYLHSLHALPFIEKRRLLYGDWDILPAAGKVIRREHIELIQSEPNLQGPLVRFWDMAATEKQQNKPEPDYTVGVKMLRVHNWFFILDVIRVQLPPAKVEALIIQTAKEDGKACAVRWEVEPGSSGKYTAWGLASRLQGFDAQGVRPKGDKLQRSKAFAAQVEAKNIKCLERGWTEPYLVELHHFPEWHKDDQVDATSGAYNYLIADAEAWDEDAMRAAFSAKGITPAEKWRQLVQS